MTWKKVNNSDPGDATHHGGDSTDKISDAFSGQDVDDIDMNCDFTLRSGKGHLRNPGNTFSYNFVGGAIAANRNINYPVLTDDDVPTFNTFASTLINKTIELEDNTLKLRDFTRVFKDGSTYYAIENDGSILSSSANPETVIQAAIDAGAGREINIMSGTYTFSGGFTGLNITDEDNRSIIMARNAILQVPNGYSGHVFKIEGDCKGIRISGGEIDEVGTPSKLWKGIHIKSTGSGAAVKHCKFDFVQINNCGWMVYLECTTTGAFINSNEFNNIWGYYPIVGFEWTDFAGNDGFLHNHYYNIDIQADSNTLYGFKNVMSRSPVFVGCEVQDMDSTDTQMLIHSSGADTIIIGGSLNSGGSTGLFTDNGTTTTFIARGTTGAKFGRHVQIEDAKNIELGTGTGTKIGTSTSQKIGFFNKTPIVQKAANADTSGASLATLETEVNELKQLLRDYGLMAT